ncbi:MAG: potassium channel protein [Andreesenia angusta]|nr:potassium channel protein [Andreesenia angusta]
MNSKEDKKKIKIITGIFLSILLMGTIGYMFILKITLIDAIYMTIITISTVGFKEVATMNSIAKLFSIFLILLGVGTVGYTFTTLIVMFVEGTMQNIWRDKRMEKRIKKLENHIIICGGGETCSVIVKEFKKTDSEFVIIELEEDKYLRLREEDYTVIHGDSTEDKVLLRAGVEKAKGLITVLPTDADNIVTSLTARTINPNLHIISKAIDETSHEKLKKVGADKTISMNEIGGSRIAALMMKPHIISFLDVVTRMGEIELDLEQVEVSPNSYLNNLELRKAEIPKKTGLVVLAVKSEGNEKLYFNPSSNYMIKKGDILLVLGREEQIEKLRELAN